MYPTITPIYIMYSVTGSTSQPGPAADLPKYRYSALPTPTSIRLIADIELVTQSDDVAEADDNDDAPSPRIRCSLKTFDLQDSPHYDCLSYTWENPFRVYPSETAYRHAAACFTGSVPIIIDNQILLIRRNLHDFLLSFIQFQRQPHHFRGQAGVDIAPFMWIDVLCINQEDLGERTSQLVIMDRVYNHASVVIAWLGGEDAFSRLACHSLQRMANYREEVVERAKQVNPLHTNMTKFGLSGQNPSFSIYAFFKRTWFSRAWIVQEAVLARQLVFICGTIVGSFTLLTRAAQFLYRSGWWGMISDGAENNQKTGVTDDFLLRWLTPDVRRMMAFMGVCLYEPDLHTYCDPLYTVLEILDMRAHFRRDNDPFLRLRPDIELQPPTYANILTRFRGQQSSDPRDKIYAFLGLRPSPTIPQLLVPNYAPDSTPEQVYTAATLHLLHTEKDLKVLSQVEDRSQRIYTQLPSWVPDFHVDIAGIRIGDSVFSPFLAAGDIPLHLNDSRSSQGHLELRGMCVDEVVETAHYKHGDLSSVQQLLMNLRRYYMTSELPEGHHIIHWRNYSTHDAETPPRTPVPDEGEEGPNADFIALHWPSPTPEITRRMSDPWLCSHTEDVASKRLQYLSLGQQPLGASNSDDNGAEGSNALNGMYARTPVNRLGCLATSDTVAHSLWLPASKEAPVEPVSRIQSRIEVLWRTLLADCCDGQHPAPWTYGFAFSYEIKREMHRDSQVAHRQMLMGMVDRDEENHIISYNRRLEVLRTLTLDEPGDFAYHGVLLEAQEKANTEQREGGGDGWSVDIRLGPTRFLPDGLELKDEISDRTEDDNSDAAAFWNRRGQISKERHLFRTKDNLYLGIGPESIVAGDQVWILAGSNVPHILRTKENGNYELIGESYVHGIMHGETTQGRTDTFRTVTLE